MQWETETGRHRKSDFLSLVVLVAVVGSYQFVCVRKSDHNIKWHRPKTTWTLNWQQSQEVATCLVAWLAGTGLPACVCAAWLFLLRIHFFGWTGRCLCASLQAGEQTPSLPINEALLHQVCVCVCFERFSEAGGHCSGGRGKSRLEELNSTFRVYFSPQ